MNVVIAGAGQAAASGAAKLRAMGCTDPITIIGQEPVAPYQRPPLSKAYLLGDMALDRLLLRKNDWWADHDITLRLGEKVLHIDRRARQVTTTRDRIGYETLILALGAEPLRLPDSMGGALAGVHYIRNLADIDHLAPALRPDRNLVVIGGGYIGLEAAAVARKLGLNVTLVEAAPRILSRVAAARTADLIRDLHHAHGVKLIEGVAIMKLIGTDRVRGVALSDGRQIAADLVICGIGARPETALAKTAGLAVDNGIITDMFGRTDDPQIWAAGDCASMSGPDGLLRLESVGNAIDMAEAVAANIMGADTPYQPKPWFWSDQFDAKLQIAGLSHGHDHTVLRKSGPHQGSVWYFRSGRLIAVDALNDPRAYMIGKRLIESGCSPTPQEILDVSDLKSLIS